jgi:plasmid stabilization system protein ParE
MNGFIIAPAALGDLDEIWDYYATQLLTPDVADRIRDEIFEAFHTLAKTPGLGHSRMDLAKEPLRFFVSKFPYPSTPYALSVSR